MMASTSLNLPIEGGGDVSSIASKYIRSTRFAEISAGTSGSVALPSNSTVVLDDFGGTTDAVLTTASGGPTVQSPQTSSGDIVATSFDAAGNYTLTGTPSSYPVYIIYRVRQTLENFDSDASNIWGMSSVEQSTIGWVPSGGSQFDILRKSSNNSYATEWAARETLTDPARVYELHEDFEGTIKLIAITGTAGALNQNSTGVSTSRHVGIVRFRVSTLNGFAMYTGATNVVFFGTATWTFETLVRLGHLSDGTDNHVLRFGFGDTITAADITDGAYFEYNKATSDNWLMCTANGGVYTRTATSTAAATGSWIKLKLVVNSDATLVTYYINDVSVGTVNTNIPTSNATGFVVQQTKSLGSGLRDLYMDYARYRAEWASGTKY